MKKTEMITTPKTTQYCDHCKAEIRRSYQETSCMICKKDTCHSCSIIAVEGLDNTPIWCKHCNEIGKPYRAEIKIESNKHEKVIKDIHARWKEAALQ